MFPIWEILCQHQLVVKQYCQYFFKIFSPLLLVKNNQSVYRLVKVFCTSQSLLGMLILLEHTLSELRVFLELRL